MDRLARAASRHDRHIRTIFARRKDRRGAGTARSG
jgi:hypothetical protein